VRANTFHIHYDPYEYRMGYWPPGDGPPGKDDTIVEGTPQDIMTTPTTNNYNDRAVQKPVQKRVQVPMMMLQTAQTMQKGTLRFRGTLDIGIEHVDLQRGNSMQFRGTLAIGIAYVDHRKHVPARKHPHRPMVTVTQMIAHVPRPRARRDEVVYQRHHIPRLDSG
jgi:hypothetical protein